MNVNSRAGRRASAGHPPVNRMTVRPGSLTALEQWWDKLAKGMQDLHNDNAALLEQ